MNRKRFLTFTWLMWLALPLTAFGYGKSWDRLPLRMATHFDINWHPNGWMSREMSFRFAVGITAFLLVVFTVACYAMLKATVPASSVWAMMVVFYIALGFLCFINNWVVQRNSMGQGAVTSAVLYRNTSEASASGVRADAKK